VFTFRCAGCGKQHVVNEPFEQDYSTPCLRCGEPVRVTAAVVRAGANGATPDKAVTARLPAGVIAEGTGEAEPPTGDVPLAEVELVDDDDDGGPEQDDSPPDADEESPESGPDWEAAQYPPAGDEKGRPLWPLLVGVTVLVLALAGGGAYFFLARGTAKKTPQKSEVAKTTTKKARPTLTHKSTEPDKPKGTERNVKPQAPPPVRISAVRLAAELAADAAATNKKYKDVPLEVSGLFLKVENRVVGKPPARPSAKPYALFACDDAEVGCELPSASAALGAWRLLLPRRPFTVRGTLGAGGYLHDCELLPAAPPADAAFKGQAVEVVGIIKAVYPRPDRPFPTVRLEGDTDSIAQLDCLFRIADEDQVKRLRAGLPVTVQGTCGGRVADPEAGPNAYAVRIDNCQLTDAPAPPPSVRRLAPAEILRPYEEDLRVSYVPPPGAETQVAEVMSLARLGNEWTADPKAMEKKYRNRVLTVSGRLVQKEPAQSALVLASGETDQPLRLRCLFDRDSFGDLGAGPEFRVRGRFTGLAGGSVLRLDSCRPADAAPRDLHRLTADFLPHRPGRQLIYDLAEFPVPGKKEGPVRRVVFLEQEDGKSETVITHAGTLSGKGLFDGGDVAKWVSHRKTTALRVPGPAYHRRVAGGFVEVGQAPAKKGGTGDVVWQPVLKIAARAGDSWKWSQGGLAHEYTVEKFEDRDGRPAVIIKETVTNLTDGQRALEKRHVYVRGVGEVEQRDWLVVSSKERVVVGEKKLVE
jgi:hypothetical protein